MGLLRKKREEQVPKLPSDSRISTMASEDIYLLIETSIMTAQHQLSEYRALPQDMKLAALNWIDANLIAAKAGVVEMMQRNISPQT